MFWTLGWAGDQGLGTRPAHREPVYSLVGGTGGYWVLQSREEEHQGARPPQTGKNVQEMRNFKMDLSKSLDRTTRDKKSRGQACSRRSPDHGSCKASNPVFS